MPFLDPPIIAPLLSIKSPSVVTILTRPMPILLAIFISSTINVLPKICSNAVPCTPSFFDNLLRSGGRDFDLILFKGKKVTTPLPVSFNLRIQLSATPSSCVTTDFIFPPAITSNAKACFGDTFPSSEIVPCTPGIPEIALIDESE